MKYPKEMYLGSNFYDDDTDIENHKEKIVRCRKPHKCMGGCNTIIQPGEYALLETGFMDGKPVSSYTCLLCIEDWLEESGQIEAEVDKCPTCRYNTNDFVCHPHCSGCDGKSNYEEACNGKEV